MREILFKAKRIDNGEWIEGFYTQVIFTQDWAQNEKILNGHFIISKYEFWDNIDPKTLSQYTGLKDKHGNKIFENDIVNHCAEMGLKNATVEFIDGKFSIEKYGYNLSASENFKIIGNKFDNPELLTKE